MKPIFAKENGRRGGIVCSDSEKQAGYKDKEHWYFQIKFAESEQWQELTINVADQLDEKRIGLDYSLNNGKEVTRWNDHSWVNALFQAVCQDNTYEAATPKTFELHSEDGQYWYALTEACKQERQDNFSERVSLFRSEISARRAAGKAMAIAYPNLNPGPRFSEADDAPIMDRPAAAAFGSGQ